MFTELCEHVRVADLCRNVRVDRKFCNLCVDEVHPRIRWRILASPAIDIGKQVSRALVALLNQQKVRIVKIANDRSERNELRVVAKPEISPATFSTRMFQCGFDFAAG